MYLERMGLPQFPGITTPNLASYPTKHNKTQSISPVCNTMGLPQLEGRIPCDLATSCVGGAEYVRKCAKISAKLCKSNQNEKPQKTEPRVLGESSENPQKMTDLWPLMRRRVFSSLFSVGGFDCRPHLIRYGNHC